MKKYIIDIAGKKIQYHNLERCIHENKTQTHRHHELAAAHTTPRRRH